MPLDRDTRVRAAVAITLVALIGLAFVGSHVGALHEPRLHGVDLAVAGPASVAAALDECEAFDVAMVPSRAIAVRRLEERRAVGAVIVTGTGAEILRASAAGSSGRRGAAGEPGGRGAGAGCKRHRRQAAAGRRRSRNHPFYLVVALVVTGYVGAAFLGLAFGTKPTGRRVWWRLLAIAVLALVVAPASVALVNALGPLGGSFLALSAVSALLCLTVGAVAVCLQSALGIVGTGVSILLFVVLGNPASGGAYSNELLPGFRRTVGPLMPTAAGVDPVLTAAVAS